MLAELDWVVASLHTSFDRSPTERILGAIDNPHVDCIGHLTGRRLLKRDGAAVDVERVVERAAETGTALEINSQPDRLDLRDTHARLAGEAGVRIPITTDAHSTGALDYAELGVAQARRAWLTKEQILNTRSVARHRRSSRSELVSGRRSARARLGRVVPRGRARASGALAGRAGRDSQRASRRRRPRSPSRSQRSSDDLDAVLLPGLTHWQSPRFFAYFATTGSEPGVLAELLIAGLNQVGILWRTSPALQELEEVTLDWLRQLVGLPEEFSGHIEDTASTGTPRRAGAWRACCSRTGACVVCSEHAHSLADKAAKLLELELRKVPVDDAFRLRPGPPRRSRTPARSSRRSGRRGRLGRSRCPRSRMLRGGRYLAPRRRCLRGVGRGLPGAPRPLSPAGSAPTRSA